MTPFLKGEENPVTYFLRIREEEVVTLLENRGGGAHDELFENNCLTACVFLPIAIDNKAIVVKVDCVRENKLDHPGKLIEG